jgi:6-phosphogluconolactonase
VSGAGGPDIRVLEDPAAEVARLLGETARAGGHVVLTGGSSPKRAYEMAAAAGDDWSRATLWFGDERCVAPDDDRSNFAMVRDALLSRLDSAPAVHRMEGERGPADGASAYEAIVRQALGDMPAWDLLLLGLGPDSHCASLFPNRPEKDVDDRLVVGVPEAGMEPFVPRISLTLPALNAAKRVVFLVTGESKREAVRCAFVDEDPASPAARVRPAGELLVLLDAAAKP